MQIIMNQYICFVTLWCLVINTNIVFFIQCCESARTKREKKDGKDYLFYHNSNDAG